MSEMGMKINTIDIDGVDMIGFSLKGKTIVFFLGKRHRRTGISVRANCPSV